MKQVILLFLLLISGIDLFSQNDSILKFIFIPHPRSEDRVNESVNQGIAKIDFTKFDLKMLGGDITYSTSKDSATLAYCDNLFDLSNPNTLWSFGNHDVESGNLDLIKKFTGRESFFTYNRDKVTFLVLDCELEAEKFSRTFIHGDQLQMIKNVCDTIQDSRFLILLHSRFIWMINNPLFEKRLTDSIAASSRTMDTTNFYADIYPLLQNVKNQGIQVLMFGGDKSKINIIYSPEDSITFYAARMANDFPDSINDVIVLIYNLQRKTMICNYVSLADIDQKKPDGKLNWNYNDNGENVFKIWQAQGSKEICVQLHADYHDKATIQIYSINGAISRSFKLNSNIIQTLSLNKPGIYIVKAFIGNSIQVKKFVFK